MAKIVCHKRLSQITILSNQTNQIGGTHNHVYFRAHQVVFAFYNKAKPTTNFFSGFQLYLHQTKRARKFTRLETSTGKRVSTAFLRDNRKDNQRVQRIRLRNLPQVLHQNTETHLGDAIAKHVRKSLFDFHVIESPLAHHLQMFHIIMEDSFLIR